MHEHDWFYRVYNRQTSSDVFGVFASIVELWQSRFSRDRIPEWTEFEFEEFAGWYGHISLAEVHPDFSKIVFRLWGTALTEFWDKDYTGQSVADETFPGHWKNIEQPYSEALVKQNGIGVCGGTLHVVEREFINITYVDLPVRRAGKTPFLMSAYRRDADRTALETAEPLYSFVEPYKTAAKWRGV